MARIALIGHNRPHADALIREAAFSDLFFNYSHDNLAEARKQFEGEGAAQTDAYAYSFAIKTGLRLDAIEFANSLATATGFTLDPDELVADYLARE